MKKIYNSPVTKCIVLGQVDAILQSISAGGSLKTPYGGNTGENDIDEADSRELTSKSLWDTEW